MVGKNSSLKNSKDAIERLYGGEILQYFPSYENFWLRFIGNPNADRVEAYKYAFPLGMNSVEKDRIMEAYERVQMTHYSMFCHLAGAHYQLKELQNTQTIKDPTERYFRHWEHYEVAYIHLGSAFYMLRSLWGIILKLKNCTKKLRKIEPFLQSVGKGELASDLTEVEDSVKIRRDQAVHYGRAFAGVYKGEFYVPLRAHRDMKWSDRNQIVEWIPTFVRLKRDIIKTEKLINALHEILVKEYQDFINQRGIQISSGESK